MSVTIMADSPEPGEVPCVGAICDHCQEAVVAFDSVAFSLAYLNDALAGHDCGGTRQEAVEVET